jgi:hypothetical protein
MRTELGSRYGSVVFRYRGDNQCNVAARDFCNRELMQRPCVFLKVPLHVWKGSFTQPRPLLLKKFICRSLESLCDVGLRFSLVACRILPELHASIELVGNLANVADTLGRRVAERHPALLGPELVLGDEGS